MANLIIYGAGGHAEVIIDAIEKEGKYKIAGLIDDINPEKRDILGYGVLGGSSVLSDLLNKRFHYIIVAIGDNKIRKAKIIQMSEMGFRMVSIIHPFSSIGKNVSIGEGTVILAGAIIDPSVSIGKGVIINHKSSIGHNSRIDDFVHVSAGAICGANISIGEGSFVGMGAKIISGITIGENVFIGAGSLVTKQLPDNVTAVGMPARIIKGNLR